MFAYIAGFALVAAVCGDSIPFDINEDTPAIETEQIQYRLRSDSKVNLNVEIYMAAERGFIAKPSDTFDGQTKSFEDFQFDMQNTLTYTAMTARGEMERGAAQVMMTILERGGRMTLDESKNLVFTGTEEEQKQAKAANDLLFTILALNTTGRARQIVKETTSKRSGVEAWVRLRERFNKTTGATSYAETFKYNWHGGKSFEDKWRDWTSKTQRLPAGSLSDAAKEALAIEAANISKQAALEQHLRLRSPQNWTSLVATVDSYLQTMYASGAEPTPMEIGAVSMHTDRACLCCGKQGHVKADCRFKDAECRSCGKTGHLSNVCKGGNTKGGGKGKVKGKTKGKDYNKKVCLCCGKEGHVKSSCRFKDDKCATCGKVGHLKAVCRSARGTHQVDGEEEDDAKSIHAVRTMTVTETNLDTTNYKVSHTPYGGSEDKQIMSARLMSKIWHLKL